MALMSLENELGQARPYKLGGVVMLASAGTVLAALAFEHIGGFVPCPLCLMQRWAFYAAVPLAFIAMALAFEKPRVAMALFALITLAYLANTGLAAYHTGVEWHYWPGPDTCATATAIPSSAEALLAGLNSSQVVRCDEAQFHFLGLSFAGWNVLVSAALAMVALAAASSVAAEE